MSSREPQPREEHAAVGAGQTLYIWGGHGGPSARIRTTTIESFDVPSATWQPPKELNHSIPDNLMGMAVTSDGENAYFFGGRIDRNTYCNTLYRVDLSTMECCELVPRNPSDVPKQTFTSGIVCFDRKLVVHGGRTGQDRTDELRVFDLTTNEWSAPLTTGEKPPPLASHTFTKVDHHRAVVFGGNTGSSVINDAYVLEMDTWHWTKLRISGVKPPARCLHATCYIAGRLTGQQYPLLMVVGGMGDAKLGDVWLLDVDEGRWSEVTLPEAITPRLSHSAVAFGCGPSFRVVVLFGGFSTQRLSGTTLLLLELREGSWQVINVVNPEELGRLDERLAEQMKKLELSSQEGIEVEHVAWISTIDDAVFSTILKDTTSFTCTSKDREETSKGAAVTTDKDSLQIVRTKFQGDKELQDDSVIDVNDIVLGKCIGQGGFGSVFEAKWKKRTVAVKVCLGNLLLSREIQILSSLPSHSNVITFYGVALSNDSVATYVITELAPSGSLHDHLHVKNEDVKKEEPSPDQSFLWALQVASGMEHLHNNNVVHRDLKSANVLLSFGKVAKVCDFGTARTLNKTAVTTQKGTFRWMAPEIMKGVEANINNMCDIFSYGMVLYEIYAHEIPYDDLPTDALVGLAVLQGQRPPIPPTLPPFLHPLLEACWKEEPKQRPQFKTIVMALHTGIFE